MGKCNAGSSGLGKEQAYKARLADWSRNDLLKVCRAAGLTAHKIKTNDELIHFLWLNVGIYSSV